MKIYIGFDRREADAYDVLYASIREYNKTVDIQPIILSHMQERGLMTRTFYHKNGVMMDEISNAPCSTEFSISRFLTLPLAREEGVDYAVFMDCDMLVTCDIEVELMKEVEGKDAPVFCVKHDHNPTEDVKMDGQVQTKYGMKNWSSFVVYNVNHPLNDPLTVKMVNTERGLSLHQFCWLKHKDVISTLPIDYNHLVGYYGKTINVPRNIHYTEGIPTMEGYENCDYADLWLNYYNEIYK